MNSRSNTTCQQTLGHGMARLCWSLIVVLGAGLSACGGGGGGGGGGATGPVVVSSSPAPGATGVVPSTPVAVSFDRDMDPATISTSTFTLQDAASQPVSGIVAYDPATRTASFNAAGGLDYGATYFAAINHVSDLTGGTMQSAYAWSFTTQAAPAGPPPAPIGLRGLSGEAQVTLDWEPVVDAASYNVYFANEPGVGKTNYAALQGGGRVTGVGRPYVHGGLVNGRTLYYVVTAVSASGVESAATAQLRVQPNSPRAWRWLSPRPTPANLLGVHFVSASQGWVVGGDGTILHSTDGGASWTEQDSGAPRPLMALHFVDALQGWAVGGELAYAPKAMTEILHTRDGGATWWAQATGAADAALNSVHFVDAANGWAVGYNGTVMHTDDGGKTWVRQSSGTTLPLYRVKFIDALRGWAAGGNGSSGVVLRTLDGGQSWLAQTVPNVQLMGMDFAADASRGWVVDGANPGRILASSDGGVGWGPLPVVSAGYLRSIRFVDNSTGWAVGTSGAVLKTGNGGASWSAQSSAATQTLRDVFALDAQTVWAVGDQGTIRWSRDGGATWGDPASQSLPDYVMGTSNGGAHMLSFTSPTTGWAVNGSQSVFGTTDGGQNWTAQTVGAAGEHLVQIQFTSASTGWAVGNTTTSICSALPCRPVYRTRNGGASWQKRGDIGTFQVWGTSFVDDMVGWAVGPNGAIAKTTDGGANWFMQNSATANHLHAVKAVDLMTAWAVGQGGLILKTVDGGMNWLGQLSGTTADLTTIAAVDASRVWVTANSTSTPLLATTDGGTTWQSQISGMSHWFEEVRFADANHGWAVEHWTGHIWATTDGGLSWLRQNAKAFDDDWGFTLGIEAVDTQQVWILSYKGLLATSTGGR